MQMTKLSDGQIVIFISESQLAYLAALIGPTNSEQRRQSIRDSMKRYPDISPFTKVNPDERVNTAFDWSDPAHEFWDQANNILEGRNND